MSRAKHRYSDNRDKKPNGASFHWRVKGNRVENPFFNRTLKATFSFVRSVPSTIDDPFGIFRCKQTGELVKRRIKKRG